MKISRQVLNKYFAVEKKILHHVLHKCSTALAYQITQYLHFHINFQFASFQKLKNNCRFNIYICTKLELKAASDSQSRGSIDINLIQFDGQIRPDPSDVKMPRLWFLICFHLFLEAGRQSCSLVDLIWWLIARRTLFLPFLHFWVFSPHLGYLPATPPSCCCLGLKITGAGLRIWRSLSVLSEEEVWTPPLGWSSGQAGCNVWGRTGGALTAVLAGGSRRARLSQQPKPPHGGNAAATSLTANLPPH